MAEETKNNIDAVKDLLGRLEAEGRIPFFIRPEKTPQRRWQRRQYPSGVNFSAPADPALMGRYNDPSGRRGICYTADFAATALAESLGRVYHQNPGAFTLGLSDLKRAHLYTLETTRETKVISMIRLQAMLHLTADVTMGSDYAVTQAITEWAANAPGLTYDGIAYPSRHFGVGMCTAYWMREGETGLLADVASSPVDTYVDIAQENFPQNWADHDITGFEIIAETLRFDITNDEL